MPLNPTPSPTPEASHWNALVIALIGSVCAVLLLFSYLKILQHQCSIFCVRSFSVNAGPMQRLNENTDNSAVLSQSQGLDSYVMHSLPITQFKTNQKVSSPGNTADCAVCLGDFEEGEWIKTLPVCSHVFHVSCIDTWFQTHSSCPLCRSSVNNLSTQQDHSISINTLLETLRREDANRSQILQRSPIHRDLPFSVFL